MLTVVEDIYLARNMPDGALIEFEERATGFRAYWYTSALPEAKRVRLPSVTTILGRISSDGGLLDWYEARGAEAALTLARQGYLDHVHPARAIDAVREAGMGAKATANDAADRGKRVHGVLEEWARSGSVPSLASFAESDRGYLRALIRWLLHHDPEPTAVERLVCHPEFGYCGRLDLRARFPRLGGREFVVDLKSNRRAQIYTKACLQVLAYHVADVRSGADSADGEMVLAVGPDGLYAEGLIPDGTAEAWASGLLYHKQLGSLGDIREVQ